jgi:hypothetical protein
MMNSLTSIEAIRENNACAERQFIARQQKRSKLVRAEAKRVAALRRAFAPRVEAQARAAVAEARAAAEAARALQALDDELREATRMEVGNDYADWHPDGLGEEGIGFVNKSNVGGEWRQSVVKHGERELLAWAGPSSRWRCPRSRA